MADELLTERGWCQGKSVNMRGEMCVLGALQEASVGAGMWLSRGDLGPYLSAMGIFNTVIGVDRNIALWNDESGRSVEDVHLAFKEAIKLAEECP